MTWPLTPSLFWHQYKPLLTREVEIQTLKNTADLANTGNWSQDNELGSELAVAHLKAAGEKGSPAGMAQVLGEMVKAGRWSGVEVGFAFALATAAL